MFLIENTISRVKNFSRRNFIWAYPLCSILILSIIFYFNSKTIVTNIDHELLLTVLSTLSGFLLTLLGILFSFRDKAFIKELINMNIWNKVEHSVFLGFMSGLIGIIFSLLNTLLTSPHWLLIYVELSLFIVTLTFLAIAGVWIKTCWKYIK